jgi:hypothetical protein
MSTTETTETKPTPPSTTTPRDVFARMPDMFVREPHRLNGIEGVYQYFIEGTGGGRWHVDISDGKAVVIEGEVPEPDCIITISDADFVSMADKKVSGGALFMRGRLRVSGRQDLAMRSPRVFG